MDHFPAARTAGLALCRIIGVGQAVFAAVVLTTRFAEPAELITAIMLLAAVIAGVFTPWLLKRVWKRRGY